MKKGAEGVCPAPFLFLFYFLPAVLLIYYLLPFRYKNIFLTIASYAFYGWFKPWYIILMLTATFINYISGIIITKEGAKQRDRIFWLVISVVVNLGLLGFFKYYMFIAGNINELESQNDPVRMTPKMRIRDHTPEKL